MIIINATFRSLNFHVFVLLIVIPRVTMLGGILSPVQTILLPKRLADHVRVAHYWYSLYAGKNVTNEQ